MSAREFYIAPAADGRWALMHWTDNGETAIGMFDIESTAEHASYALNELAGRVAERNNTP